MKSPIKDNFTNATDTMWINASELEDTYNNNSQDNATFYPIAILLETSKVKVFYLFSTQLYAEYCAYWVMGNSLSCLVFARDRSMPPGYGHS